MRPVDEDFDVTFADIERRAAEEGHSVCDEDGKPLAPIPDLIRCAINGSEHKKLCVGQIVEVLEQRFPRWGLDTKGQKRAKNDGKKDWRNTVRHTLTSRNDFFKVARPAGYRGRGNWWKIDPHYAKKGLPLRRQTSRRKTGKNSAKNMTKGKSPSPTRSPSASRPSHSRHSLPPLPPSPPPRRASGSVYSMDVGLPLVHIIANTGVQPAYTQPVAGGFQQAHVAQDHSVHGPTPPLWPASRPSSDIDSGSYASSGSSGIIDLCASRSRSGSTSSAASGYLGYQYQSHAAIALPSLLDFGDLRQYAHTGGDDDVDAAMRHLSLHSSAASVRGRSGSTSSHASSSRKGGLSIAELVD